MKIKNCNPFSTARIFSFPNRVRDIRNRGYFNRVPKHEEAKICISKEEKRIKMDDISTVDILNLLKIEYFLIQLRFERFVH